MAHLETASRYACLWRALGETGPVNSGVVAYPGLEAQPAAGQPTGGNRRAMQHTPSTPRPAHDPAVDMRQWYSEPQAWQWYHHDPTRRQLHPTSSMPGPPLPHLSTPSGTASLVTIDAMLEPLLASLKALQEGLGGVTSDVKDALSQLHALRTAQSKTDKCIAELEGVIGVSSTGTRSRGRVRRGRGRGRGGAHTEAPLELDGADVGTVPEKTLVQGVASIQSAIEALLARDTRASHSHLPVIHWEETLPPSVNLAGQASFQTSEPSLLPSFVDPPQQHPTLRPARFICGTSITPQSEPSSPLSSVAIPTPEFTTSPPPAAPEKEYADASIQACPPSPTSEPSCSLSNPHAHAPELTPAHSNVDPATLGWFASNSVQPTPFAEEYLAHFLRDAHLPSAPYIVAHSQTQRGGGDHPLRSSTASDTQLPTRATSALALSPYPSEPNLGTQRTDSTLLLSTTSSSSDTSVVPSAGSTAPPPPPVRISIQSSERLQTPSLATEDVDSSMTPPQMGPPGDSQMSLTLLSSLSSIRDTSISVSGASGSEVHVGCPGRPHAKLDSEDAQMTSDTESDGISVTGGTKIASRSTPTASGHRRQSSPVEADDRGLPSGLPTPPSEIAADDRQSRVVSRLTREHGAATDPKLVLRTHLPASFPIIPTPPFLTPEPSVGADRGMLSSTGGGSARQGSLGAFSELPSPLTPPLLSPFSAVGSSLAEEGASDVSEQTGAHKITGEHTDSPDDAGGAVVYRGDAAEGVSADMPMNDARSNPRTYRAGVEESSCATNSEVPVITLTNASRSIAVSGQDSSRVPRVGGDVDLSRTPRSSVSQPNTELPEHDPVANDIGPPYSPTNDYRYDFRFSSPWRRPSPPTSATPSRYATPSDASDSRPTQDEAEVWHALMLGGSGVSTPMSGSPSLPMMFSQQPSRASSVHPHPRPLSSQQPLSVDPSVLHDPPLLVRGGPGPEWTRSPHVSDESKSLSPLTSLEDTDVDKGGRADATRRNKAPADTSEHRSSSSYGGRHSEPYRASSASRAVGASVVRAASDATITVGVHGSLAGRAESRSAGGPSASLDQLVSLARREPLKIYLRLPGAKRKRDLDVDDGEGEGGADGERGRFGDGDVMPGDRVVPLSRIGTGTSAPGTRTRTPTPTVSRLAPESSTSDSLGIDAVKRADVTSDVPVPRKRKKKHSEGGEKEVQAARTVSEVSENAAPSRIGAATSASSMPTLIPSGLALEFSTNSGLVESAGEHLDLPASRKRTKKESERGEYARVHRKKPIRRLKAKPKSPLTYHVRNGQIVTVASESEPRSQALATPSASQPSMHAEEAGQDARTSIRTRHRKGRENQAMKTPLLLPVNPSHPSPRSARLGKSSPMKEDVWNTISRGAGTWPELPSEFSHWHVQFIQCDNCDKWYHYGCVAIESGDPRLEPRVLFICPTCHTQSARRQTLRNQEDACARPDCPEPQVTADAEVYFVEKLVGRKRIEGYIYMWLAKWEGYPMTQATWIPKENVVGDGTKLLNAFLVDAVEEGANLSRDVVLLREALDAGWDSEAC